MNISKYFTLEEATFSETAARLGIENTPNPEQLENMKIAAAKLDSLRAYIQEPIIVTSWLRTQRLNAAVPGSSNTSHHTTGFAIDCRSAHRSVLELCKVAEALYHPTGFDQIIHEYGGWMHISFHPSGRKQTLTIFKNTQGFKYKSGLLSQSEYLKA
jgi:hypothetical protein